MAAPQKKKGKEAVTTPLRVVELFAGVGGFRLGLGKKHFHTVWFNQWEPGEAGQHAWRVYKERFEKRSSAESLAWTNVDIAKVSVGDIPDHDLLVGGFPCQDYSVARTLSHAAGLVGKKGVLWWEIYRIIREKGNKAPKYLMLENVDRLLKSPVSQRGRDFAIMLASLAEQGYAVEWRIINAGDYGMPQRRRRVYILGYRKNTPEYAELKKNPEAWLLKDGIMPAAFKAKSFGDIKAFALGSAQEMTSGFNPGGKNSPFENSGVMVGGKVCTAKAAPRIRKEKPLSSVLVPDEEVPPEYVIPKSQEGAWRQLKGGKKETRVTKSGFEYEYSEGPVAFPDDPDRPSRTIVTGEGGTAPSRFKHVVRMKNGRLRRLLPEELERLNMFPKGHTRGASDTRRAFFMGNALVVGIVRKLGKELAKRVHG
jgi:DNA (cytosine-5)-methyltransferase 1